MSNRFKQAETATWIGMILNAGLAVMKGIVGWLSGSKALLADAAHSASDVAGSVAALAGLRTARKPPDDDHPYGHGKAENIAAIVVAVLLVIVGIEIAISASKALWGERPPAPGGAALIAVVVSIVVKEALFHYKYRLAARLNSPILLAEAWHHRSDALSSIAAFAGILGAWIGRQADMGILLYCDPLAGFIVSLLVIRTGIRMAKDSSRIMMEQVLDEGQTEPLLHTVKEVRGVRRVDELLARTHGHYLVIDLKVSVEASLSVAEGHHISKEVKKSLMKHHTDVKKVFVHINPY